MILLDTHAWIWWASQSPKLSAAAEQAITNETAVGVAAISCWEVAMLVDKGRLELDREVGLWVDQAVALPKAMVLALTPQIAVAAVCLPPRRRRCRRTGVASNSASDDLMPVRAGGKPRGGSFRTGAGGFARFSRRGASGRKGS